MNGRLMRNWPTDPLEQHNLFINAMCADWLDTGTLSLDGPKASRVAEINRQINSPGAKGAGDGDQPHRSNQEQA